MTSTEIRSTVAGNLLKQFWLAEGLSAPDLSRIARLASFRSMERGDAVIEYGDCVRNVYCLLGGMVKLLVKTDRRKERVIELIGAGQTFGEGLIFVDQPSPSRAVAIDDGRLLVLPGSVLSEMFSSSPGLAVRWLRRVGWRVGRLLAEMRADAGQSAAQRIVHWLIAQVGASTGETRIRLDISKATLAASLNTSPEAFSRVLKQLRQQGVVQVEGREIVVPDPVRLRGLQACGYCAKPNAPEDSEAPDGVLDEWKQLICLRGECEVPHWFSQCDCGDEMPNWCDSVSVSR